MRTQHHFVIFLPKMHNLNLILRKHKTKPNGGILYKIIGLESSKLSVSLESRKTKDLF